MEGGKLYEKVNGTLKEIGPRKKGDAIFSQVSNSSSLENLIHNIQMI
ncbi:hypothetical protein [uncultured Methanobrevibacter sp.]|nr:hypothetical protein [uncultured Methanobrevibacter sp.]